MFWKLTGISEVVAQKEKELQVEFQRQQKDSERREGKLRDELAGLKPFLNTHDDADSSELALALDNFNDLLHDFASAVSDDENAWKPLHQGDTASHEQSMEGLRASMPPLLLDAMSNNKHPPDSRQSTNLFQYGIRAVFIRTAHTLMEQFCYGLNSELDREMQNLAEETFTREIQPVYGRWRSITHESIRRRHPNLQSDQRTRSMKSLAKDIAFTISTIACLIFHRSFSKTYRDNLYASKKADITEILNQIVSLCIIVKERVVSRDYSPYSASGENVFNSNHHEPFLPVKGKLQDDLIICCTRLGLLYRGKQGRANGKIEMMLWRKPQIISKTMLLDILSDEPNDRPSKPKSPGDLPKKSTIPKSQSRSPTGRETPTGDSRTVAGNPEQKNNSQTPTSFDTAPEAQEAQAPDSKDVKMTDA